MYEKVLLKMQENIAELQNAVENIGVTPVEKTENKGIKKIVSRIDTLEKTVSKMYTLITSSEDAELPYERVNIIEPKQSAKKSTKKDEGKGKWLKEDDIQYIIDNCGKLDRKAMAEHLKTSNSTISYRINSLKKSGRIPSDVVEGESNKFHPYAVRSKFVIYKEGVIKILQLPKGFNRKAAAKVLREMYPRASEVSIMGYAGIYTKELRERELLVRQKLPKKQGTVMSPKDIHVIRPLIEKLKEECED